MGILNVTPDSFSDGGEFFAFDRAVERGVRLAAEGADLIDVGGESTRPGAEEVSVEMETRRVVPVIRELRGAVEKPISVDTRKAAVARMAVRAGATVLNDVTGLAHDPNLARIAAEAGADLVLNHMRGTPETMQTAPRYDDVVTEVYDDLARSAEIAIASGVAEDKIVIDPGIGFGKRLEDNLALLRHLGEFRSLGFPVLVGPSRKSFIGHLLGLPVEERLEATLGACVAAARNGADILRVHDVRAVIRAVRTAEAIERSEE
ncbi:MAG: dihydropteroate synthase [Candidatus Eisenbacteria bacterium]|nr:dihydropteroate synthase [Candidatus Eisenbacteria bacterium]